MKPLVAVVFCNVGNSPRKQLYSVGKKFCLAAKEFCRLAEEFGRVRKEFCSAEKESGRLPKEFGQAAKEFCRLGEKFGRVGKECCSARKESGRLTKEFGRVQLLGNRLEIVAALLDYLSYSGGNAQKAGTLPVLVVLLQIRPSTLLSSFAAHRAQGGKMQPLFPQLRRGAVCYQRREKRLWQQAVPVLIKPLE
ncbi:hypothetical protein [Candidatus Electronema sp. PJ]|uniref:hypothetical protein n=1 Tax=Candidatus Electronema sp. PJ TaxID=3401572 RepID=UPI003AA88091